MSSSRPRSAGTPAVKLSQHLSLSADRIGATALHEHRAEVVAFFSGALEALLATLIEGAQLAATPPPDAPLAHGFVPLSHAHVQVALRTSAHAALLEAASIRTVADAFLDAGARAALGAYAPVSPIGRAAAAAEGAAMRGGVIAPSWLPTREDPVGRSHARRLSKRLNPAFATSGSAATLLAHIARVWLRIVASALDDERAALNVPGPVPGAVLERALGRVTPATLRAPLASAAELAMLLAAGFVTMPSAVTVRLQVLRGVRVVGRPHLSTLARKEKLEAAVRIAARTAGFEVDDAALIFRGAAIPSDTRVGALAAIRSVSLFLVSRDWWNIAESLAADAPPSPPAPPPQSHSRAAHYAQNNSGVGSSAAAAAAQRPTTPGRQQRGNAPDGRGGSGRDGDALRSRGNTGSGASAHDDAFVVQPRRPHHSDAHGPPPPQPPHSSRPTTPGRSHRDGNEDNDRGGAERSARRRAAAEAATSAASVAAAVAAALTVDAAGAGSAAMRRKSVVASEVTPLDAGARLLGVGSPVAAVRSARSRMGDGVGGSLRAAVERGVARARSALDDIVAAAATADVRALRTAVEAVAAASKDLAIAADDAQEHVLLAKAIADTKEFERQRLE